MKIVIDIDEDIYFSSKQNIRFTDKQIFNIDKAIYYGVILPKGHGKLIDADEEIKYARKWIEHPNQYISQRNKDFIYYLEKAETVIPADR